MSFSDCCDPVWRESGSYSLRGNLFQFKIATKTLNEYNLLDPRQAAEAYRKLYIHKDADVKASEIQTEYDMQIVTWGGGKESDMGAGVLSGPVCGERGRAGSGCCVRWDIHQSSRHRSRGPGAEYLARALAHAVLQGELPAPSADQVAVGPGECLPACVVHSGGMIS